MRHGNLWGMLLFGSCLNAMLGCAAEPPPQPQTAYMAADPLPRREPLPSPVCAESSRTIKTEGWDVEILRHTSFPQADGGSGVVLRIRDRWEVLPLQDTVPNTQGIRFTQTDWADIDYDGTIVFNGHWMGNRDHVNGVGAGIYRYEAGRSVALVDSFTLIPNRQARFTELGIPDVENGMVAFWGGRGSNEWSGIFLWTPNGLVTVADSSKAVVGTDTPRLKHGQVLFGGKENNKNGLWLYTIATNTLQRIFLEGDSMPGSPGERIVSAYNSGDLSAEAAFFPVGNAQSRAILGWHQGTLWKVVSGRDIDAQSPVYVQTSLSADGSSVAFSAGAGQRTEIWVATGCTLERVIASGMQVKGETLINVFDPDREALQGDTLYLGGKNSNNEVLLLRARRRTP